MTWFCLVGTDNVKRKCHSEDTSTVENMQTYLLFVILGICTVEVYRLSTLHADLITVELGRAVRIARGSPNPTK